jgi:hypothetical protein
MWKPPLIWLISNQFLLVLGIHFSGIESIPRNAYTYIKKDDDM